MPVLIVPKLGSVIQQLKTSFQTVLPTIDLYLGEPITSDVPLDFIMISSDGDPDSDSSADFEHVWHDLAHTRMREDGEIPCALVSQTGDDDVSSTLTTGFATLQACVNALGNDPTLGGLVMSIQVSTGSSRQIQNNRGTAVVIPFTVMYWAIV